MVLAKKMLRSMTACGRATLAVPLGHFTVELYSVNRRHLEINNCFPQEFLCFDADLKRWIASAISRGFVTAKLVAQFDKETPITLRPNLALARQLKKAWEEIAFELDLPPEKGFKLEMLSSVEQMILFEDNPDLLEDFRVVLQEVVKAALDQLVTMKEIEGIALSQDILNRLENIKNAVIEITHLAPGAPQRYREELKKRLEEILPGRIENEERILRELCIYAEKLDVSEELTRLKSHVDQFTNLVMAPSVSVGKTLEFLVQEINREINTVGSKASELKISQLVIVVKSELERIREQIQNIE